MPDVASHPPGVFDVPEAEYRADPALSCSEARKILSAPARYLYDRAAGEQHADHFDFGKAAHTTILGVGAPVAVLDFDDWRTKDARQAKADAYEAGLIPVLASAWTSVEAMAAAVRAHPIASRLINPERGTAERSLFWSDERTGLPLRARLDWCPHKADGRRLVVVDLKSTPATADPRSFGKSAASFAYHQQAAWYLDGVRRLIADDAAFVFVVVEKSPPHLVNVIELDGEALAIGRDRNRRAIDVWAACLERDEWPGYPMEIASASLPRWAALTHDDDMAVWSDDEPQEAF